MRYKDEFHIAVTAVMLSIAMVGISVVVPKENRVPRAKTTLEEAPETAAEAEEAGFPIYSQESNYGYDGSEDYSQDYSDSSDSSSEDSGSWGDTSSSDSGTDWSDDTTDGSQDIPDYTEDPSQDYGEDDSSDWEDSGTDAGYDTGGDGTDTGDTGESDQDIVVYE